MSGPVQKSFEIFNLADKPLMRINNCLLIFYQMKFVFNPAKRTGFHFLSLVEDYAGHASGGFSETFSSTVSTKKIFFY